MSNAYMPPSATVEWETPQALFNQLDDEFHFTLDAAASQENAKVSLYYDLLSDGLKQSWDSQTVWCNPPYGRQIKDWVKKASEAKNSTVVMLIPSRTDTRWFHEHVYDKPNIEVRFIRGRLKFGGNKDNAPFPNMIVIWRSKAPNPNERDTL
jgi:phage N-6-adenine-methyltransferase